MSICYITSTITGDAVMAYIKSLVLFQGIRHMMKLERQYVNSTIRAQSEPPLYGMQCVAHWDLGEGPS